VQRTRAGSSARYAIADPSVFTLCELVCDALRERYDALHSALSAGRTPVGG
jgi:hypothetical protein